MFIIDIGLIGRILRAPTKVNLNGICDYCKNIKGYCNRKIHNQITNQRGAQEKTATRPTTVTHTENNRR